MLQKADKRVGPRIPTYANCAGRRSGSVRGLSSDQALRRL